MIIMLELWITWNTVRMHVDWGLKVKRNSKSLSHRPSLAIVNEPSRSSIQLRYEAQKYQMLRLGHDFRWKGKISTIWSVCENLALKLNMFFPSNLILNWFFAFLIQILDFLLFIEKKSYLLFHWPQSNNASDAVINYSDIICLFEVETLTNHLF